MSMTPIRKFVSQILGFVLFISRIDVRFRTNQKLRNADMSIRDGIL
jgi:hypothetical protein